MAFQGLGAVFSAMSGFMDYGLHHITVRQCNR